MKKILSILILTFLSIPAYAYDNSVVIQSKGNYTKSSIGSTFVGTVAQNSTFENGITLETGMVLKGLVVGVTKPKRGKRDEHLIIMPVAYVDNNVTYPIDKPFWRAKAKEYEPLTMKDAAITTGTTVASVFVKGLGTAYNFGQGFLNPNEEDGRLKTGAKEAYNKSIVSYIDEGKPVEIQNGELVMLNFYSTTTPAWQFWKKF